MGRKKILQCIELSGKTVAPFVGEKYYLSTGALKRDIIDHDELELVTYDSKPSRANIMVKSGDIAFAKMAQTDKTHVFDKKSSELIVSTGFFVVRPKQKVNEEFLFHYFMSDDFHTQKNQLSTGATQKALTNKGLAAITIPDISYEAQGRIADVLDRANVLNEKHKVQIEKLDLLIKSQFIEMFGDPATNPKGWKHTQLGKLFKVGSSKRVYQRDLVPSGVPFLRVSDLVQRIEGNEETSGLFISEDQYADFENRSLVPKSGDILMTSRGTLGACYIVSDTDRFYFQDGMISWLKSDDVNIEIVYIMHLFKMNGFRKQIDELPAGSTVNYLSIARIKKLMIMYPDYNLQAQFADFVHQVEAQKSLLQESLEKLEQNYKSLMQKCFRGEIF